MSAKFYISFVCVFFSISACNQIIGQEVLSEPDIPFCVGSIDVKGGITYKLSCSSLEGFQGDGETLSFIESNGKVLVFNDNLKFSLPINSTDWVDKPIEFFTLIKNKLNTFKRMYNDTQKKEIAQSIFFDFDKNFEYETKNLSYEFIFQDDGKSVFSYNTCGVKISDGEHFGGVYIHINDIKGIISTLKAHQSGKTLSFDCRNDVLY